MADAREGDLVQVDVSGVEASGVSFGEGIFAPAEIVKIDPVTHELHVRLGFSSNGDLVTVPAERAKLVPAEQVDSLREALGAGSLAA
jgi:hypothetical protein